MDWEGLKTAYLDRERARPAITAETIRARLFARPRPRLALPNGRAAPQTFDGPEPLPLP